MIEIIISETAFVSVKSDNVISLDEILLSIKNGNEILQDPFGQVDVFRLFGYFMRDDIVQK